MTLTKRDLLERLASDERLRASQTVTLRWMDGTAIPPHEPDFLAGLRGTCTPSRARFAATRKPRACRLIPAAWCDLT